MNPGGRPRPRSSGCGPNCRHEPMPKRGTANSMLPLWFWDNGFYGRVDQLREPVRFAGRPAALFVATQFYNWYGIPLFPLGGYVVVADPGLVQEIGFWTGIEKPLATIRIRLAWKSIVLAYLRAALVLGCPAALVLALITLIHGLQWIGALALVVGL